MIICVANSKGGVGKTATAAILAQAAIRSREHCLAIDADSQGNLTYTLGADPGQGTYNLITGQPAQIQTTEQGMDVLAASWDLATLTTSRGSARRLKYGLKPFERKYPIIVIDTPTATGEAQINGIAAADLLIIPMQADSYNLMALFQITSLARKIRPDIDTGIILTNYNTRTTLNRQMMETIRRKAQQQGIAYYGTVRSGIAVQEAAAFQRSLFDYAPKSKPAADYMEIWHKINEMHE